MEGISDIRDESNRKGMRIVYELKKDAIPQVVCNNLYKQTELQNSFSVNNVVLVNGIPAQVNLKELITHYVTHRHNVVQRRTKYDHDQAAKKLHLLEGILSRLIMWISLLKP